MKFLPFIPERTLRLVLAGLVLLVLLAGILLERSWSILNKPLPITETVTFQIAAGSSLARISEGLVREGYLSHPRLFMLWARSTDNSQRIQAGEYELDVGLTPRQLLDKLIAGDVKQYQLTLVEGWTFQQALDAVWASPAIDASLRGQTSEQIASLLNLRYSQPEGLLFPDTYYYTRGITDREILQRASQRLDAILASSWEKRVGALPFETAYQALVLASIVEKETAVPEERRRVAGVFIRRLEQGMRLQSDPTVIYGMGQRFNGNIDRAALNEQTPYNTYRINGLPPTPIALAGRGSIDAVLDPEPGEFLYFVSRGDGSHYFSTTLEEHNAAVRQFQLRVETLPDGQP